jgi:hypothetical protein
VVPHLVLPLSLLLLLLLILILLLLLRVLLRFFPLLLHGHETGFDLRLDTRLHCPG